MSRTEIGSHNPPNSYQTVLTTVRNSPYNRNYCARLVVSADL